MSSPPFDPDPSRSPDSFISSAGAGAGISTDEYAEYARFMSFITAHYLECKAEYDPLSVFVSSKIDPIPYQLFDFAKLMEEERRKGCIRALIAYETGLGKTILVGMVIKELLGRGSPPQPPAGSSSRTPPPSPSPSPSPFPFPNAPASPIRRVLIVVPPSVLPQFRSEMRDKFGLEFSAFDPSSPQYSDLMIASMDTLKLPRWTEWLSNQTWDLVVVDEYHRASPYNLRGKLVSLLTGRTKHFVALTATPHDGASEKYRFRLVTIAPDPLVIRRTKREGRDISNRPLFDHEVEEVKVEPPATQEEMEFYESAERYVRNMYRTRGGGLLATIVGRAISSSIRTGLKLLKRRRDRIVLGQLEGLEDEEAEEFEEKVREGGELTEEEIDKILGMAASREELEAELQEIEPLIERGEALVRKMPVDSKGARLYGLVKELTSSKEDQRQAQGQEQEQKQKQEQKQGQAQAQGQGQEQEQAQAQGQGQEQEQGAGPERGKDGKGRKAIIFTSFRETVEYLKELLREFEPLEITGSTDMEERKRIVEEFTAGERHRVLIGTDAMGESLNLQAASVEINYEVPWSPVAYIQRVGRIWRLKQENRHLIIMNFLPPFPVERRVMEVLLEKIRTINGEFGEIGLSVFGRELGSLDEVLRRAYTSREEEGVSAVEGAFESALRTGREVVEVLKNSMSLPRVVNAEDLQQMNVVNLSDIVTEEDLKRFLAYLKDAGLAVGEFPGSFHVLIHGEYRRVDSLSLESRGMRAAIEAGKGAMKPLRRSACTCAEAEAGAGVSAVVGAGTGPSSGAGPGAGFEGSTPGRAASAVRFNYFKSMEGEVCMAEVRVNGSTVFREPVVQTPEGILTYRGVLMLAPSFTGRETAPSLTPLDEYEESLKRIWLERARSLWEDGRDRLMYEYNAEKDDYKKSWISQRLADWMRLEPKEQSVSVELKPLGVAVGSELGQSAGEEAAAKGIAVEFVPSSPEEVWRARWEVEKAAMETASEYYRDRGYIVEDVSRQNRGYDLECYSVKGILRVEVKGLRGWSTPELTQNEKSMAEFHRGSYVLFVVKLEDGGKTVYEVPDPYKNLEFRVVWKPFYEVLGLDKFRVGS